MTTSSTPVAVAIPTIEQLTDAAARLLQQQLAQAAQAALVGGASPSSATAASDLALARSNLRVLAFAQALGVHGAYRYLRDFVARQAVPSQASGAGLDAWLDTYLMPRKVAQVAAGTAQGTGVNGTVLAAGALLQTDGGLQVRTTAAATVASGTISAPVSAVLEGAAGNLPAGTALSLVSPVSGIDSAWSTSAGLAGGADLESDEDAHTRLAQRLGAEPRGGCPADYARWALQVAGITRAWGLRNPGGGCTAGVIIMADGNAPYGIPTTAQRDAVAAYISDPRRGPPDELFVVVPIAQVLNLTIALVPDTTANRAAVTAAIDSLLAREAIPGGSLPHNHLVEAISAVVGEYNHTISSPTITSGGLFTVPSYQHLLVRGTITWV